MTAPAEMSRGPDRIVAPQAASLPADTIRALLLARLREQAAQLARHQATLAALTANRSADLTGRDRAVAALHMYGAREAIEDVEDALVRIDTGEYGVYPACGSTPTTATDAADAVRRLVALAGQLLRRRPNREPRHHLDPPKTPGGPPLQRVTRLRDEVHVTANRVARFGVDDDPILDPIRITVPTATSARLGPEQLLFQLDLSASRLIALLGAVSPREWARTGQLGDRLVTLGELVDRVVYSAVDDLLDLLPAAPMPAPERRHVMKPVGG